MTCARRRSSAGVRGPARSCTIREGYSHKMRVCRIDSGGGRTDARVLTRRVRERDGRLSALDERRHLGPGGLVPGVPAPVAGPGPHHRYRRLRGRLRLPALWRVRRQPVGQRRLPGHRSGRATRHLARVGGLPGRVRRRDGRGLAATRGTQPLVAVRASTRLRPGRTVALGGAQRPAPVRPAGRAAADRAGRRRWPRHGRPGDAVRPHRRNHHRHHLPVGHGGEDRRTRRPLARRAGHRPQAGQAGHVPRAAGADLLCRRGWHRHRDPAGTTSLGAGLGALALSTAALLLRQTRSRR